MTASPEFLSASLPDPTRVLTAHGMMACRRRTGLNTIVLVHGLGGDSTHFSELFHSEALSNRGLIAVDLLGAGDSAGLPSRKPYSFELQAQALSQALGILGLNHVTLAVHSLAAGLLPWLKSSAKLKIDSLFMIEGNLIAEDTYWSSSLAAMTQEEFKPYWRTISQTAHIVLAKQFAIRHQRAHIVNWSASFSKWDPRAIREMAIELYQTTISGTIADAVSSMICRKVYLRGEDGRPWSGRPLLIRMNTEYVGVPEAGHYLMLDAPEEVAAALLT